jgi:hypothetical protein
MTRQQKAPAAAGEQSPMSDNAVLEADAPTFEVEKPVRKFAREVNVQPEVVPTVTCRVTSRGEHRISTGLHVDVLGDEKYAAGEEFQTDLDTALMHRDGDLAYWIKYGQYKDWVDIIDRKVQRTDFVTMLGVRGR